MVVTHAKQCVTKQVVIARAERIPGRIDCTASCVECGRTESWTEQKLPDVAESPAAETE